MWDKIEYDRTEQSPRTIGGPEVLEVDGNGDRVVRQQSRCTRVTSRLKIGSGQFEGETFYDLDEVPWGSTQQMAVAFMDRGITEFGITDTGQLLLPAGVLRHLPGRRAVRRSRPPGGLCPGR